MKKKLIASGPWFLEKIVLRPVYYYGYPESIREFGFVKGYIIMSVAVMIISLTFMRLQDKVSVDIFGAARLRQGLLAKLRLRYKSETTIKWLVSIFTVWQFFPPIMVLSLRQSNHPTTRKEFMQVIALTWIASLYWSGVAKGFLILPVWAIKGIVLAITLYLLFELMRWGMKTSRTQKNRP